MLIKFCRHCKKASKDSFTQFTYVQIEQAAIIPFNNTRDKKRLCNHNIYYCHLVMNLGTLLNFTTGGSVNHEVFHPLGIWTTITKMGLTVT